METIFKRVYLAYSQGLSVKIDFLTFCATAVQNFCIPHSYYISTCSPYKFLVLVVFICIFKKGASAAVNCRFYR